MNKKTIILLLILIFFTGCATTGTYDGIGTDPSFEANLEPMCWFGLALLLILVP